MVENIIRLIRNEKKPRKFAAETKITVSEVRDEDIFF